ncbi:MarR family transcriptional regulator [Olsenella uli]|uniref:MarR family winged helix-turn-helix transcriptional regulator n=1 Tax=Olsenella uli TaxID=133926 RepID=UPI0012AC5419|nr:MarR family transcriptional regulator [Olsenella uli]
MDYEVAANKLLVYSRALAKGSLSTAYGLSMGEAPVLDLLSRMPDGMSPSYLASRLGYTRSRMTRILDSLSAKGYVRRAADSHDRRRVTAFATEKGRKFSREQRAEGVNDLAARLTTLGEHDTKELLRVLEKAYSITYDRDRIVEDEEPGRD